MWLQLRHSNDMNVEGNAVAISMFFPSKFQFILNMKYGFSVFVSLMRHYRLPVGEPDILGFLRPIQILLFNLSVLSYKQMCYYLMLPFSKLPENIQYIKHFCTAISCYVWSWWCYGFVVSKAMIRVIFSLPPEPQMTI